MSKLQNYRICHPELVEGFGNVLRQAQYDKQLPQKMKFLKSFAICSNNK